MWEEQELLLFGKNARNEKCWTVHGAQLTLAQCEIVQEAVWRVRATQCDGEKCPGVEVGVRELGG